MIDPYMGNGACILQMQEREYWRLFSSGLGQTGGGKLRDHKGQIMASALELVPAQRENLGHRVGGGAVANQRVRMRSLRAWGQHKAN